MYGNKESLLKFYGNLLILNRDYYSYADSLINKFIRIFESLKNEDKTNFGELFRTFFPSNKNKSISIENFEKLKKLNQQFGEKMDLLKLYETTFLSIFDFTEKENIFESLDKFSKMFQDLKCFWEKEKSDVEILYKIKNLMDVIIFPGLLMSEIRCRPNEDEYTFCVTGVLRNIFNLRKESKKCLFEKIWKEH